MSKSDEIARLKAELAAMDKEEKELEGDYGSEADFNDGELSPIDQILDPENDENIVLTDPETGEKVEFEQVAIIPVNEELYCILAPVEKFEGVEDGEAPVFHIFEDEDGEFTLEEVLDEETLDLIFEEYTKLWEKSQK